MTLAFLASRARTGGLGLSAGDLNQLRRLPNPKSSSVFATGGRRRDLAGLGYETQGVSLARDFFV